MSLSSLSAVGAAGFVSGAGLLIAIGAQNAFVLRQGLQRRHVALVVAVCALSDMALILSGVAGMGLLVRQWPELLQWLRWCGAAFLAGYGLLAAQRAWRGHSALAAQSGGETHWQRVLWACLGFTFLNPHTYLDTVVLLGALGNQQGEEGRWLFGAGAITASLLWFFALAYGARLLSPLFRRPVAWRVLDSLIALTLLTLALNLFGA